MFEYFSTGNRPWLKNGDDIKIEENNQSIYLLH